MNRSKFILTMVASALLQTPLHLSAAVITKSSSGTDLTAGASWGITTPTSIDIATWSGTSLGAGLTIGTAQSWMGIDIEGAASAITISSTGSLTLGTSGINIAAAGQNLTISNPVILGGDQGWTVGTGRSLTVSGGLTAGSATNVSLAGAGTVAIGASAANITYTLTSAATKLSAAGVISGNVVMNSGIQGTISGSNFNKINGVISGDSGLIVTGSAELFGANTFTGGVTVSGFSTYLTVNSDASFGAVPSFFSASNITIASGGSGISTYQASAPVVINANRGILLNGNLTVDVPTQAITINGIISGSFGLVRSSNSGITLNGLNTYTGISTLLTGGTTTINTISTIGGGASSLGAPVTVANGQLNIGGSAAATLVYTGSTATTDRVVNLAGTTFGATLDQSGTGLLKFTNALTATGTGSKTLTLQGSTSGTGEIAGAIVDNSSVNITSLTKSGSGTWALSGANSYTGVTNITAGTLRFAAQTSLYNNTNASWTAANLIVNSGATSAFNVGGTGEFTTADVTTLLTNLDGAVNSNGLKAGSSIGLDTTNASGGTFTISNIIANTTGTGGGAVGLVKLGAGTLVLSGASTFTGPTSIAASGTLKIGTGGQFGAGTYAGSITNNGTLEFASSSSQTFSGVISGTGSIIKTTSSGILYMTGFNTYTGATTVNSGTIVLSGSSTSSGFTIGSGATLALRSISLSASQNITGAGNLTKDISNFGSSTIAGANNNYSGTTVVNISTFTLATAGVINGTSGVTVQGQWSAQFSNLGTVTTTGAVNVNGYNGNGTASTSGIFSNGNVTGTTPGVLTAASLTLGADNRSSATLVAHGGEFYNYANSTSNYGAGTITVNGQSNALAGGMVTTGSTFTNAGSVSAGALTLNSSSSAGVATNKGGTYSQSSGTTTLSGTVTLAANGGSGGVGTAGNDAALSISGGTYSANAIAVNSGTLSLSGGSTLNVGSGGVTTNGLRAIQVNLGTATVGASANWSSAVNASLTDATTGTTFNTTGGNITLSGGLSGSGNVLSSGTQTFTLSGSNTYSGSTTATSGTLAISSTGTTGSGAVTVQSGGTILGSGTVQGSSFTAQSGSSVYAGDGIAQSNYGTLIFKPVSGSGSFNFQSGSNVILGINPGGTGDLLSFNGLSAGSLLFNGNLQVTASGYTPTSTQSFKLMDWANLTTVTFASQYTSSSYSGYLLGNGDDNQGFDLPNISGSGYAWDISQFTTNGTISTVFIVPEPSRMVLLGLGLMVGLFQRLRRMPL